MTPTNTDDQAADGGTMDTCTNAHRGAIAARAQTDLIDMLARLVHASVEHGAASVECGPAKRRNEKRGNQKQQQ